MTISSVGSAGIGFAVVAAILGFAVVAMLAASLVVAWETFLFYRAGL